MSQTKITNLLKQRMGLDVASLGQATIDRAVRLRMARCSTPNVEDYWRRVSTSDEELQELIETVVVPETWLFRDRESFAVLANLVLNEWLPAHPTGVLHVLSLPCSTGEEPYSIAMALLDAGLPPDRFRVDGVDISTQALAHAQRAIYGKNSFRGGDLNFRKRYFSLTPSGYQLVESVRARVHFQPGNVLALDPRFSMKLYDVIFCRNMLIYFDHTAQEMTLLNLHRLLAQNGVLFVGPAEAFLMQGSKFNPIRHPGAFAFRKASNDTRESPQPHSHLVRKTNTINRLQTGLSRSTRLVAPQIAKPPAAAKVVPTPAPKPFDQPSTDKSSPDLETASQLADAGRLAEAATVCEAHLRGQGPSARAYYLLGIVRDALGQQQQAAEYYRKVLYLEPGHGEALMHLALLLEKQGDAAGARRLQERARRIEERVRP